MLLLVVGVACGSSESAKPTATAGSGSAATQPSGGAATQPSGGAATQPSGGGTLPAGNADNGKALATSLGCVACHSTDGSKLTGPSWKGLYGSQVELEGGTTVTADDAYIHESIIDPNAKVVKGYAPIMPSFATQVDDQKVADLIAYIMTLK